MTHLEYEKCVTKTKVKMVNERIEGHRKNRILKTGSYNE